MAFLNCLEYYHCIKIDFLKNYNKKMFSVHNTFVRDKTLTPQKNMLDSNQIKITKWIYSKVFVDGGF